MVKLVHLLEFDNNYFKIWLGIIVKTVHQIPIIEMLSIIYKALCQTVCKNHLQYLNKNAFQEEY